MLTTPLVSKGPSKGAPQGEGEGQPARVGRPRSGALFGPRTRTLLRFFLGRRRAIALVLGLTVSAGALGAAEPLLLGRIVDGLLAHHGVRAIAVGIAVLAAIHVLREGLGAVGNLLTWRVRLRVQQELLDAAVGRLHELSVAYHRRHPVGRLLTKLDRGIQGFVGAFSEVAFNLVPALVFFALAFALMLRLEWRLCLALTALLPLPALITGVTAPRQVRRDRVLLERWTRIYARFGEVLGGIATVKSFAMEQAEKQRFIRQVDEANGQVLAGVAYDSRVAAVQSLSVALTRLAVLGYGALLALEGRISVGTLLAFLGYLAALFGPVQGLTTLYRTMRKATVAIDAIFSILEAEEIVRDAPGAREVSRLRGELAIDDVWFGYTPDRFVLRGVSLRVPAGETVALVGPSGGGKTSLAALLQRLYDPQHGELRIDGLDLRAITQRSLRAQIGAVMQDALLFNDSVRANIAYGRPEASLHDVETAARAANAEEFIRALPEGYDTIVGERGGLLSAGQRQRLAIARVLLRDPPIVILDEATSALDAESEAQVAEALGRLRRGRTTLIIAHRLATVVRADRIVVLRGGRVTELGSHQQLMAAGGHYASLVALQTRGLLDEDAADEGTPAAAAAE